MLVYGLGIVVVEAQDERGKVIALVECSNEFTCRRFYEDLEAMKALYGGETDAVQ